MVPPKRLKLPIIRHTASLGDVFSSGDFSEINMKGTPTQRSWPWHQGSYQGFGVSGFGFRVETQVSGVASLVRPFRAVRLKPKDTRETS